MRTVVQRWWVGGTQRAQSVNRCAEMRRNTHTVQQKNIAGSTELQPFNRNATGKSLTLKCQPFVRKCCHGLERRKRAQSVDRCAEMRRQTHTVQQKSIAGSTE